MVLKKDYQNFFNSIQVKKIYVWDTDEICFEKKFPVIFWRNFQYINGNKNKNISINELVESNSDYYKKRYLEWVYKLGKAKHNNKTN